MNKITLKNCLILTMTEKKPLIKNGKILIKNDKIKRIGNENDFEDEGKVISMKHKLVMPGLINTHSHSVSPLFRGMADDLELMDWLNKLIWPAEKHLTSQAAYWGAKMSILEYISNGITTFIDQYYFVDSIAEAVKDTGIRAVLAPSVFSNSTAESKYTFQVAQEFVKKYKGKEDKHNIYTAIGPHAPYSCSENLLREVAQFAKKENILIHTHISETQDENEQIKKEKNKTPTEYLNEVGVLDNKVIAAHCIHLDDNDLDIFKNKKVAVSYNPISNLKLVSGIMPMKKMKDLDILITVGTDGAQSNNSLDLLRDLKTGVLLQKQINKDATFIKAKEAVEFITVNAAEAVGLDSEIGTIEEGKKADIISVDLNSVNLNPVHHDSLDNIYSAIAYSASGHEIKDVIINGQIVMRDKNIKLFNVQETIQESKRHAKIIMKKAGLL